MRMLILDNAIDHDVYSPVKHWAWCLRYPYDAFRASKGKLPEDIVQYSHVILTGSEASITDEADWISAEEEFVRRAVADGKAVLGSCFGHQLLARALFGKDAVGRSDSPEIGWEFVELIRGDPLFGDAGAMLPSFLIHFDEVKWVPGDKADVIAMTRNCQIHVFRVKDRPAWGIQAHPEIGIGEGRATVERMIDQSRMENSPRLGLFLKARESVPKEATWFGGFMKKFQEVGACPA